MGNHTPECIWTWRHVVPLWLGYGGQSLLTKSGNSTPSRALAVVKKMELNFKGELQSRLSASSSRVNPIFAKIQFLIQDLNLRRNLVILWV